MTDESPIGTYNLRFPQEPTSLDSALKQEADSAKIHDTRVTCTLAIGLLSAACVLDVWAIPSALDVVLVIRAAAITLLLGVFFVTRYKVFLTSYTLIAFLMYSVIALAVDVTVFLAAEGEFARDIYFAGIILMIMGIYTWLHVRLLYTGLLAASIVGVYSAIMVAHGSHDMPLLMGYLFFLGGAMIIGHMSQSLRLSFMRENEHLRRSLHQQLADEGHARQ